MATKRKPQDATMRNVKAAKKRTDTITKRLNRIEGFLLLHYPFAWPASKYSTKKATR